MPSTTAAAVSPPINQSPLAWSAAKRPSLPRWLALFVCLLLPLCASGQDRRPRPISQTKPEFPLWARVDTSQGQVLVAFVVDAEGKVRDAKIVKSDNPVFDDAALAAVRLWRFEPGMKDGKAVSTQVRLPIVFSYEGFWGETYLTGEMECLNLPKESPMPQLVSGRGPDYPGKHWRKNVGGTVEVLFTIGADGRNTEIELQGTPDPLFAKNVLKAVGEMQFAPPVGETLPRVRLRVTFVPASEQKKTAN